MPQPASTPDQPQLAVYWDLENLVLSQYDEVFGRDAWRNAKYSRRRPAAGALEKLRDAWVDVPAVLEYAAGQGSIVVNRAYGDWSAWYMAAYDTAMQSGAVDLVQLFPISGTKNGADIRLAVDVVEDLYLHQHITDVIVVAGDSDYVALAQRCRRLGRRIIGVGIKNHSAELWRVTCDEFKYLDLLAAKTDAAAVTEVLETPAEAAPALDLLLKAVRQLQASAASGWVKRVQIKPLMLRLDSTFDEAAHGFTSFTSFLDNSGLLEQRQDLPETADREYRLAKPAPTAVDAAERGGTAAAPSPVAQVPVSSVAATRPPVGPLEDTLRRQKVRLCADRGAFWETVAALPELLPSLGGPFESTSQAVRALGDRLPDTNPDVSARQVATAVYKLVRLLEKDGNGFVFLQDLTATSAVEEAMLRLVDRLRSAHGLDLVPADVQAELLGEDTVPGRHRALAKALATSTGNTYRAVLGDALRPSALFWGCMLALSACPAGTPVDSPARLGVLLEDELAVYGLEMDQDTAQWLSTLLLDTELLRVADGRQALTAPEPWEKGDVWPLAGPVLQLYARRVRAAGRTFTGSTFASLLLSDYYDSDQLRLITGQLAQLVPDDPIVPVALAPR